MTPPERAALIAIPLLAYSVPEESLKNFREMVAAQIEEAEREAFSRGLEAEKELCKHPIYCRGCGHCGEEGCCGTHEVCPSGRIIEENRKEAYKEGWNAARGQAKGIAINEINFIVTSAIFPNDQNQAAGIAFAIASKIGKMSPVDDRPLMEPDSVKGRE